MERKLFSFLDAFYSQTVPSFSSRLRDQEAAIYLVLYVPSSLTTLILKRLSYVLFALSPPPNLAQCMFEIVNSFHDSISKVAWKAGGYGKSQVSVLLIVSYESVFGNVNCTYQAVVHVA